MCVLQACLFSYFSATMDAVIVAAKSRGTFDNGIVTLKGMTSVKLMHEELVHTDTFSGMPPAPCICCASMQLDRKGDDAACCTWRSFPLSCCKMYHAHIAYAAAL